MPNANVLNINFVAYCLPLVFLCTYTALGLQVEKRPEKCERKFEE